MPDPVTSIFLVYPDRAAIRHSKPAVKSVMTRSSHKRSEIGVDYAMSNISGARFSTAATLENAGNNITYRSWPGMGHIVNLLILSTAYISQPDYQDFSAG